MQVDIRRVLLLFAMIALVAAPFGRMAAAEAMTMPHHAEMTMAAGHCDTMPASDPGDEGRSIDCMIACAAMAPAPNPFVIPAMAVLGLPAPAPTSTYAGIRPEADPPPPRLA